MRPVPTPTPWSVKPSALSSTYHSRWCRSGSRTQELKRSAGGFSKRKWYAGKCFVAVVSILGENTCCHSNRIHTYILLVLFFVVHDAHYVPAHKVHKLSQSSSISIMQSRLAFTGNEVKMKLVQPIDPVTSRLKPPFTVKTTVYHT